MATRDRPPPPHPISSDSPPSLPPAPPVAIPLQEHIKRGWDWIVFVWQMLRRMGGPLDLLIAFWTLMTLLFTRLLIQLGMKKK